MTRLERRNLSAAIWQCIGELSGQERRYTSSDVRTLVKARHADLIEEAKERLIDEAISRRACRMMKAMSPHDAFQQVLFLPAELHDLKLPHAISLKVRKRNGAEEIEWIPLYLATPRDLEQHLKILKDSIAADQRRMRDLAQLLDYVRAAREPGWRRKPIGPLLEALADHIPRAA